MEKAKAKKTNDKYTYAKGGRKTAVAQCRLFKNGKGKVTVNGKELKVYFPTKLLQDVVLSPLVITNNTVAFDIDLKVHSGGLNGQAEAARHAISRALEVLDKEWRKPLKAEGFLKRDPRVKERKKPGLRRARRAPQWSKR